MPRFSQLSDADVRRIYVHAARGRAQRPIRSTAQSSSHSAVSSGTKVTPAPADQKANHPRGQETTMLKIGDAELRRVEDMTSLMPMSLFTQDEAFLAEQASWSTPRFMGRLYGTRPMNSQSWVLRSTESRASTLARE